MAPLEEAGWDRPTPADGWAVRDQMSHLAYFDDAAVSAMTDPTAFAALVVTALKGGDPMEEHLRRGRSLPGTDLLGWWRTSRTALVTATGSLPEGARVPWFGPPMGALSFVSARLMETWAHGQDVADALEDRSPAHGQAPPHRPSGRPYPTLLLCGAGPGAPGHAGRGEPVRSRRSVLELG